MLSRIFAILVCLAGLQVICSAEDNPRQEKADHDKVSVTGDQTLEFGPFVLQGEDLKVRLRRKGQRSIVISGNARLVCGNTRFIAKSIEASWKNSDEMYFNLWGNVEIQNISGQLRMYAPQAALFHDQDGTHLVLQNQRRGPVTLLSTSNQKTTELVAVKIDVYSRDSKTFRVVPTDLVSFDERDRRLTDQIRFEASAPSEYDIFNQISKVEFKIPSRRSASGQSQKISKTEFLQLLK
ncbi:MAG: hypothetical protein ACIAZJ_25495 [Gimesia chilikensis]|uniref:hypothetical protein n=1 Tax=Gimesia chilikensis TaxID=2605989 RepID=UPI003796F176